MGPAFDESSREGDQGEEAKHLAYLHICVAFSVCAFHGIPYRLDDIRLVENRGRDIYERVGASCLAALFKLLVVLEDGATWHLCGE